MLKSKALSFYCPACIQSRIFEPMSQLNFAIIGCGKIAPRHAAEAVKHGQLVAVCDTVPEKADQLAKEFASTAYYSVEEMLSAETKPGIVAVCTPNGLHATHAILALEGGCHVLCEKPLCISSAEGKKMIDAALSNNRKLFVVKSTRYNPAIVSLKKMIDEKKLGAIYSFQLNCFWNRPPSYYYGSWRGTDLDGGALYTQFSHYLDALLWLLGDIRHITGFRNNLAHKGVILSEDSGAVAVQMVNGIIGGINWSVNTYKENMEVSLSVIAEKGSIRLGGGYMNKIEYQLCENTGIEIPEPGTANDYGFYKGSMSNHDKVYENLVKALKDDTHPFTSAEDGLKTVEIIERIYNSVSLS